MILTTLVNERFEVETRGTVEVEDNFGNDNDMSQPPKKMGFSFLFWNPIIREFFWQKNNNNNRVVFVQKINVRRFTFYSLTTTW